MSRDLSDAAQPLRGAEWIAEALADVALAAEGAWHGQGLPEIARALERVALVGERIAAAVERLAEAEEGRKR